MQKLPKREERTAAFQEVTKKHGFCQWKGFLESWANQNYGARAGSWVNDHLDSPVIQKLAIRAGKGIQLILIIKLGDLGSKAANADFILSKRKHRLSVLDGKARLKSGKVCHS